MFRAPTQTPHILTLLDDMPTQQDRQLARHLGLSASTIAKYRRTGEAPRLVHLALFWESRWGLSVLDCEIENRQRMAKAQIETLQHQVQALQAQVARLSALGDFGAANDPLYGPGAVHSGIFSARQAVI